MFGGRQLEHFQSYALRLSVLGWPFARVALVDKRTFNRFASRLLHFFSQLGHLGSLLFIGRCDEQRQQVAKGIDGDMNLTAFPTFMAVKTGSRAAFRSGLQRTGIKDNGILC
jgi:hypothetical protein